MKDAVAMRCGRSARFAHLFRVCAALLCAVPGFAQAAVPAKPVYKDATYGGETVTLENRSIRLNIHKRLTGWGWVEIFNPAGEMVAVLDNLGEASPQGFSGFAAPLRIEAQKYELDKGDFGQRIRFPVRMRWYETLANARIKNPALNDPLLDGTVTITLDRDAARVRLSYEYKPLKTVSLRYLRGPWLRVGAGTFGVKKTDGIVPGVEWLEGDEWSSGTDYMMHPRALRVAPHPFKLAAPVMTISHAGTALALSWNPLTPVMEGKRYPQPVYASPNFIDRLNHHVMGLSLPSVAWGMAENTLPIHAVTPAATPLDLRPDTPVKLEAEISLVKGTSFDAFIDWVKRIGLPEPPPPRYSFSDALDRIARVYNTGFWHEGKGWGRTADQASPQPPTFLERYVKDGHDRATAQALGAKIDWALKQLQTRGIKAGGRSGIRNFSMWKPEERLAYGRELMSQQREDGAFAFDPDGRHNRDLQHIAAALLKPLGEKGSTGVDLNAQPTMELLILADLTGEQQFRNAARKSLDYCLRMERPDTGDWWETPLRSPNLLAAGNAAVAYYLGYKAFGDQRYLEKARHWIRSLLVFTHLWQPGEITELYNTKPCLNQTVWYGSSWVDNHVQWEVLRVFANSSDLGIDWRAADPEIDWHRYQKGITVAVLRWMVDHQDSAHKATPPASDADLAKRGVLDTFFYDVHDSVAGDYKGALIEPSVIAVNLWSVLDREKK